MKNIIGRKIVFEKSFTKPIPKGANRFSNLYSAWEWCKHNGYSYGSTCGNLPIGLMIGEFDWIAKWKNLTPEERNGLDGMITFPFSDAESCMVVIYKESPILEAARLLTEPRTVPSP